jgi:Domain of unknown function (DUF4214)
MDASRMMKGSAVLVAVAMAAAGTLQAAGTIKSYTNRPAFAADDAVDWVGVSTKPGGDKGLDIGPTFTGLASGLGTVVIGGFVPKGSTLKRFNEGINLPGNFTGGDRLLVTLPADFGPLTITFTSGPVFGAGLQIDSVNYAPYTGQLKAFDIAGNLLGTVTVTGTTTNVVPANNTAPFMGIRSTVKEIARLEIDTPGTQGFAVNKLDVALTASPILNPNFFVNQTYLDLLNRAPTAAELVAGLAVLNAGPTGLTDLATQVYTGAEFHTNANYLTKCYLAMLGRNPDIVTWQQIYKVMQTGVQPLTTLTGFLTQPEYLLAYPATLTNSAFVLKLYTNLLGRAPEPAGLNYWTFILNLGIPRSYALNGFIVSPEYDFRVAHRVDANVAYMAFLRRVGEPGGINFWTVTMDMGIPLNTVVGSFVTSPEYLVRC